MQPGPNRCGRRHRVSRCLAADTTRAAGTAQLPQKRARGRAQLSVSAGTTLLRKATTTRATERRPRRGRPTASCGPATKGRSSHQVSARTRRGRKDGSRSREQGGLRAAKPRTCLKQASRAVARTHIVQARQGLASGQTVAGRPLRPHPPHMWLVPSRRIPRPCCCWSAILARALGQPIPYPQHGRAHAHTAVRTCVRPA